MSDTAILAISIDSSPAKTAADALDRFAASGVRAGTAAQALATATQQAAAGTAASAQAIAATAMQSASASSAMANAARSSTALGVSAGQARFQTLQLSNQLQDLFVQIQSGGSPLTALIEQGSQISAVYGGAGAAVSGIAALITPAAIGIGAAAAALAAVGLAAYQGSQQASDFQKALVLTGNAAGLTADSFNTAAKAIAASSKTSIGSAKDILQAFAATGEFGPKSIGAVSEAAATLARISGESADDVVKAFLKMSDGSAKWAVSLNKSFNFLSGAQYDYIRQLEAQGKGEEAAKFAADALNTALKERERPLGTLMQLVKDGKDLWGKFWDAAQDVGRPETVQDKLAKVRAELAALNSNSQPLTVLGPAAIPTGKSGRNKSDLQDTEYLLGIEGALEDRAATERADKDEKNKNDLLNRSETYQSALTAVMAAGNTAREAMQSAILEKNRIGLDQSYATGLLDLSSYMDTRFSIESAGLKQREAVVAADIALEKSRKPGSPQESIQQQAKLIELASKRYDIEVARARLNQQQKNFELTPTTTVARAESPDDAFRRSENTALPALDQSYAAQRLSAMAAAHDMLESNKQLNVGLITDDKARGEAQIALDVDVMKRRLDLTSTDDEARRQAVDALADYTLARQKQLAEQLKPEFQKTLEGYTNTPKLTRDSFDEFGTGLIKSGEDAWASFATTGKLSVSSVKNYLVEEFARIQFREVLGALNKDGGVTSFIGSLFHLGTGLTPASTASSAIEAAATAAKTADTTAIATHTISVSASALAVDTMATSALAAAAALSAVAVSAGPTGIGNIFSDFTLAGSSEGASTGGILNAAAGAGLGSSVDVSDLLFSTLMGRATGGAVDAGTAYQVGERGPEILSSAGKNYLLPGADGTVTPNNKLGGGDHFDFSGAVYHIGAGVSRSEMVAAVQQGNAETMARIQRSKRTGGSFS